MSRSVVRIGRRGKGVESAAGRVCEGREANLVELDTRVELIQALIPIGLEAVNEVLQQEVCRLAGERYSREGGVAGYARWGGQRGSVYLADQKVSMTVPRVRDTHRGREIPLSTYQALQDLRRAEDASLRKVLKGLSCRDYEPCVEVTPYRPRKPQKRLRGKILCCRLSLLRIETFRTCKWVHRRCGISPRL